MMLLLAFCALAAAAPRTWELGGTRWESSIEQTSTESLPGLCDDVNQTAGYIKISGGRNKNYFYCKLSRN